MGKKYVMKYTTVSGVDGFDGTRKAPLPVSESYCIVSFIPFKGLNCLKSLN